ncbi:MAG: hypothetical protein F4X64_02160 [Chloroflexi bacterium]|nr:hypothetical protein [Chloroflexota bacterium]
MARQQDDRAGWIGIPSVPPERAAQAFAAFYLALATAIAVDVLLIIYNHEPGRWQLTVEMVFDDGGQIMAWALAATWPIMEAMRMVLAGIFEKRIFRRGREQGREENQQLWEAWNRRRLEAEERGEAFREPPPGTEATNGRQS